MFLYSHWCVLSITTRHTLAAAFGIKKKSSTEVVDNVIKSDGYAIKDIEFALTVEAMQKYVGTNEIDMMFLWKAMVDKAEGRETKANMDTTVKTLDSFIESKKDSPEFQEGMRKEKEWLDKLNKPKVGRPKKNAKS